MDVLVVCPDAYDRRAFARVNGHRFHFVDADALRSMTEALFYPNVDLAAVLGSAAALAAF